MTEHKIAEAGLWTVIVGMFQVVLIVAKVLGFINWPWAVVLFPLWLPFVTFLTVGGIIFSILGLAVLIRGDLGWG